MIGPVSYLITSCHVVCSAQTSVELLFLLGCVTSVASRLMDFAIEAVDDLDEDELVLAAVAHESASVEDDLSQEWTRGSKQLMTYVQSEKAVTQLKRANSVLTTRLVELCDRTRCNPFPANHLNILLVLHFQM